MEILKKIFTNKWFILLVSVLCAAYTIMLGYFAYIVFFYEIEYVDKMKFAIIYSALSLVTGLLYFYTRRSFLTAVSRVDHMKKSF